MHMPVDPRLGRRRRVGPHIAGVAVRQIEDEEVCLARHTPDHRTRLAEVRLPMAGWMDQRHEHLPPPAVMFARIVLHDPDRVKTRAVTGMEVWVTMICGDPT